MSIPIACRFRHRSVPGLEVNIERDKVKAKVQYHHGDLRDHLVQAAEDLIGTDGMHAFKVAEACRLAGVSTAAPYRHFRDREDILDAVSGRGFERLREDLLSRTEGLLPGTQESICACGIAYVAFAVREPHVFRLMFGRRSAQDREQPPIEIHSHDDIGASTYRVLLEHVARYLDCTAEDSAVLETSLMLWTGVHGLSSLLIDDNLDVSRMAVDIDLLIRRITERLLP